MGTLISLLGFKRERRNDKPAQPRLAARPQPAGKTVGSCDLCHQDVTENDVFWFTDRVTHQSCLTQWNKERGWEASRRFMYHTLAHPFADALGVDQVRPLIDQFLDDATQYALAFNIFNCLETMLRDAPLMPDKRACAKQALDDCKDQLRSYLQPLPR